MQQTFAKQFESLSQITGLPFVRSGRRMIAACYMSGQPHRQKDKTYAVLKKNGVYLKEQGGEDVSLPEYLEMYGDKSALGNFDPNQTVPEIKQPERIFVDPIFWESTIPVRYGGNLFTFLSSVFPVEKVTEVFHRYNVGESGREDAIFWYMNELGDVCHDAIVPYGLNGKRLKERGGYRRHQVDMGYSGQTCFGSHLLRGYSGEVCVTESEKAALIMALVEKKGRVWVATGGTGKINLVKEGWKVFGDFDQAGMKLGGEEWWKGLEVEEGWGVDDFVLNKIMKYGTKI